MTRTPTVVLFLLLLGGTGCGLPRDADGTLDRVRHGVVRVGMVVDTPWVTDSAGGAGGVEGRLTAELARRLGARVEWVRRPEAELLTALSHRELDLVVGGFTADAPWSQEVAFTKPYYTDTLTVGVPAGTPPPGELKGDTVAVESGDPVAAELRKKDAVPRVVRDLTEAQGAVAAPTWRLAGLRRTGTGIVLHRQEHVLAAAQGENAWLVEIERLLHEREPSVPALLRSTPP